MLTVFTDLDGTLLGRNGLSDHTREVCLEFQKNNRLVLATGRNYKSVEQFIESLCLKENHGALILMNGMAFIDFQDGEIIMGEPFDLKDVKRIVRIGSLLMYHVTVVTKDERYSANVLYDYLFYFARWVIKHKSIPKINRLKEYPENIMKIELGSNFRYLSFNRLLRKLLKKYEVMATGVRWIEILPQGVNKADYVHYYQEKYHLDPKDLYIFGDGENDCEMLSAVENSYAMGNALAIVRQSAKHQCGSNLEDGVANVLENILWGKYEADQR